MGVLPEDEENVKDQITGGYLLVHVTEAIVIGEHMALPLDIGAIRPDVGDKEYKHNARSFTDKDSKKKEKKHGSGMP